MPKLETVGIPFSSLDTDPTAAANSDAKVMTQKAVRDYVAANAGGASKQMLSAITVPSEIGGKINPASLTQYSGLGVLKLATDESDTATVMPFSGTIKNFYVRTGSTAATGGESSPVTTLTIRKNGVDTAVTLTMTQDINTTSSDTTHTVAFTAGDILTVAITTDSGGNSAGIVSISMEFDPS